MSGEEIILVGNNEKTSQCGENFLKLFGTSIEAFAAGPLAKVIRDAVGNLPIENKWLKLAVMNALPAYGAGAVFALLGTTFRYILKYEEDKRNNSRYDEASLSEYLWDKKGEMALFAVSLWGIGGTSFGIFTACAELAKGLGALPSSAVSTVLGFVAFATGNLLPTLSLPWDKLMAIAGVFIGFSTGSNLVPLVTNSVSDSIKSVVPYLLPAGGGAIGGFGGTLFGKAAQYVKEKCSEGNDSLLINEESSTSQESKCFC